MNRLKIGIFNDSFPPTIDGVANTTINYARAIHEHHGDVVVATPWYPKVTDQYPFEVVRYPSAYLSKKLGYRAGNPFDPFILNRLRKANLDLIHSHSPFISLLLARLIRFGSNIPIVFTYHTKFDIEFHRIVPFDPLRSASVKLLLSNINACDEVWVVSEGAGENLRGLGYTGEFRIMENGSDFPKGKSDSQSIQQLRSHHQISDEAPVFLFVGRMMWYKGIRLLIDGLKVLKQRGYPFRMVFVGDGYDREAILAYAKESSIFEECIFTGAIYDRELLRVYYSMADLFLFPSTFDTNGIAVTEAAACGCASLLITGSCAAERVTHMDNGILIKEDASELADAVTFSCNHLSEVREMGRRAEESIYISWDQAVAKAYACYEEIVNQYEPRKDFASTRQAFIEDLQQLKEDLSLKKKRLIHYYREKQETIVKDLLEQLRK